MMSANVDCPEIAAMLADMKEILVEVRERLRHQQPDQLGSRSSYTVEEVAKSVDRSAYVVRGWCRDGRINASKRAERRGGAELWSISAEEIRRYRDEGLLPPAPQRNI